MVKLNFEETIQFGLTPVYHNSLIIVSDILQMISLAHQVDLACFFHDSEMTKYDQLYLRTQFKIVIFTWYHQTDCLCACSF